MTSVTRLGDFWKLLGTNFLSKVAQMFVDFLGSLEDHNFISQTGVWLIFGQLLKKIGQLIISTSGHTVDDGDKERARPM